MIDRRRFSLLLSAIAAGSVLEAKAEQTEARAPAHAAASRQLASGVYPAGKETVPGEKRTSQAFLAGMLSDTLRLEAHESVLQPGAPPEAMRNHLHSEVWFMKAGTAELWVNGTAHTMKAGDMGLVVAGDMHYVKNVGTDAVSYFVLAVGPPEG